ncbi:NAD(P)-dependent oxidoreductase [Pendulispora albinea]|uniref:NAD(P)H-binding protein n=1 Tax=Pendulispora albinea TaxID=2741071 RepID=A0ABZ2LMJ0_9BACT
MRIVIFGALGNVGSRVVAEAIARGHDVTAVVRNPARFHDLHPAAKPRAGDAATFDDVISLSAGQHVAISATRPAPGRERELVASTKSLLAGAARTGTRLLIVGGAATLTIPGTGGKLLDDPHFLPPEYLPIARACADQLETCRTDSTGVNWAYLSPPAELSPGARTGTYRVGKDELLLDTKGDSRISLEDLAVALLDEAERPRHERVRFTVGY